MKSSLRAKTDAVTALGRRELVYEVLRAAENAAREHQPFVVPRKYAADSGLAAAWSIGFTNECKRLGRKP